MFACKKKKWFVFGSPIFSLIFVLNWDGDSWIIASGMGYFTLEKRSALQTHVNTDNLIIPSSVILGWRRVGDAVAS